MQAQQLNWITNFIWGIADDVLRDLYVRGKNRDVILPMTVIRRLDAVLEPSKQAADNIIGGPEYSTLSNDAFPGREFDFMLSNPPYGKSWKGDLERMGGKKEMRDPRFVVQHRGEEQDIPQPLRSLEEIRADFLAVEQEAAGLLEEILGGML